MARLHLIYIVLILTLAAPLFGSTLSLFNNYTILTKYIYWILICLFTQIFISSLCKYKNERDKNSSFIWFTNLYFTAFLVFQFIILLVLFRHFQHQKETLFLIIATIILYVWLSTFFNAKAYSSVLYIALSFCFALLITLTSFSIFSGSISWESIVAGSSLALIGTACLIAYLANTNGAKGSILASIQVQRVFGFLLLLAPAMILVLCFTERISKNYILVILLMPFIVKIIDPICLTEKNRDLQLYLAGLFTLFSLILLLVPLF